jgi:class III poly(R)-hydroxyalkanoic acid synthase PhaE subunit
MPEATEYFDSWLNSQKATIENWMDMTKNFQKTFMGLGDSGGGMVHEYNNLYNSWIKTVGNFFDNMMTSFPIGVGKDAFAKLFTGADAYVKLYDFWRPINEAMLKKEVTLQNFKDFMDPSKYKDIVDKIFGFNQPETMTELFGQSSKLLETWGTSIQNFVKPWGDAMQKNFAAFPGLAEGKTDANLNIIHNMYNAFQQTAGKALKMPQVGKDRVKLELMMSCIDKYSVYAAKNTEFRYVIYQTGQKAMEKVTKAIADKLAKGAEVKHYDEFFKIWTDENEDEYYKLFKTEKFSKLQGDVLAAAMDSRKHVHKLMELYLDDFPVVVRSEMNDLYLTVYQLRKRVRSLEQSLKNSSTKEVA